MGTEKRQRKKQNRELGRQLQAQAEQRRRSTRRAVRIAVAVIALVGVFFLIAFLTNGDDTSTSDTVAPVESSTPAATDAPAPSEAPGDSTPVESESFTYGPGECAPSDGSAPQTRDFSDAPQLCIDPTKSYVAEIVTNKGTITIALDAERAPGTVNNFVNLARFKYFDATECHRAIPGFVVQCGDPTATGTGGPGYRIADELPAEGEYEIGSLAMANSGPDTNGSQFFIISGEDGAALPPSYSLFGKVTDGLDVVAALDAMGNPEDNGTPPLERIDIVSVTITES